MKNSKCLSILYLLFFLATSFSAVTIEARKSSTNKHHNHKLKNCKGSPGKSCNHNKPTPTAPLSPPSDSNTFNVLSFGAIGDGATNDSLALTKAWEAACKVTGATVEIPAGYKFFIKPITLQGPCMPQLQLQIDGTMIAPPKISSWPKSGLFQWINIKWVHNFTIQGHGVVDGQGSEWWASSHPSKKGCQSSNVPSMKPTALRFYAGNNIIVRDITIINSPLCHLKFDNSIGVKVQNVSISSPEDSPNTDGIHLQNSRDVEIHHSTIASGDDCVSIQTGCSNVHVHHLTCGPGHGVSLGGLGKGRTLACVSDIVVENIQMHNTLYGVRIKTWPGGIGSVKNVSFSKIQVSNVKVPLIIDQYYCENNINCKNQTGAIAISSIEYNKIRGTFSNQPVHLACSNDVPCIDVNLVNIQLKPAARSNQSGGTQQAFCLNSYGRTEAPLMPSSIDYCLRDTRPMVRVAMHHEKLCQQQQQGYLS